MRKVIKRVYASCLAAAVSVSLLPGATAAAAQKAKSITVTGRKTFYLIGEEKKVTGTLKVTVKPKAASQEVTFVSSNPKVAKVSAKGKVTAVGEGKATITVTAKGNKKIKKKVKIRVKNGSDEEVSILLNATPGTAQRAITLNPDPKAKGSISYTSDREDIATVDQNGVVTGNRMGQATITAVASSGKTRSCKVTVEQAGMTLHDPSLYTDPVSGRYYSFGSHLTAAVSDDLIGWSATANAGANYSSSNTLFTKNYTEEFAKPYAFTMPDGARENAWAPDIIYNTAMKKYCMYISIVDGSKKCCIAMASSDQPDGPYAYQGMLVCSGMDEKGTDMDKTNVAEVLGISAGQARESKYAKLGDNSPDCIDPTVFYDHEGKLWMVYGSFTTTGGIRLLRLDPATGLRGENYHDSGEGGVNALSVDDPYYGKKIANSNGEGPYIQMVKNAKSTTGYYYYLWTSTGNLNYYGGYNMRMVRAEKPEGPYYDTKGNVATKDLQKYALGLRVMDNYQFSFMDSAYVSCGGNSATQSADGKTFIQFHQRTSKSDSYVQRTHQTFMNEDGWLVTAPFEYNGETIQDSYAKETVAGDYEFIYHRDYFAKTTIKNMDYVKSERLTLKTDGTVTGAYHGKWELNGHNLTVHINGQIYKGVVLEQYEQTAAREKVMVFTAVGSDNRTIWGSKMHKSDQEAAEYDAEQITVPEKTAIDFELVQEGLFGSTIVWSADKENIHIENGMAVINREEEPVTVTLKAVVSRGGSTVEKEFPVELEEKGLEIDGVARGNMLALPKEWQGEEITWSSSDEDVIFDNGNIMLPSSGYRLITMKAAFPAGDSMEFPVLVFAATPQSSSYSQDYGSLVNDAAIAGVWQSKDKQNCLYVESDKEHESFIKFAAGNTSSSQGAKSEFGITQKDGEKYTVEFDVALEAGTADTTEFALTGKDVSFVSGDENAGIKDGYIFKLSAKGNTDWAINDSEDTFYMPTTWVHVTASVDPDEKKAAIVIEDKKQIYYSGEIDINGNGKLNGLYLHWAAKQSLVSVDNIKVY